MLTSNTATTLCTRILRQQSSDCLSTPRFVLLRALHTIRPFAPVHPKVGRGSMWATEVIDRAKGAERTCPVGSAPLNETSQSVPIRAPIVINVDDGRASLAAKAIALLRRVWSWVTTGASVFVTMQLASLSYSATFPLRVGGKVNPRVEYMAYWRRFLAVVILRVVSSSESLLSAGHSSSPMYRPQYRSSYLRLERGVNVLSESRRKLRYNALVQCGVPVYARGVSTVLCR